MVIVIDTDIDATTNCLRVLEGCGYTVIRRTPNCEYSGEIITIFSLPNGAPAVAYPPSQYGYRAPDWAKNCKAAIGVGHGFDQHVSDLARVIELIEAGVLA